MSDLNDRYDADDPDVIAGCESSLKVGSGPTFRGYSLMCAHSIVKSAPCSVGRGAEYSPSPLRANESRKLERELRNFGILFLRNRLPSVARLDGNRDRDADDR
jgi:hypothetical protein